MAGQRTLIALLLFAPAFARAQDDGFRFDWRAPEGCPSREHVLTRAEHLLGRPLLAAAPATLRLEAVVEQSTDAEWQLRLSQESSSGSEQRSVRAARCEELGEAAALLLALSIDPSLASEPGRPTSGAFPEPSPAPDTQQPAPSPPSAPVAATARRPLPVPAQRAVVAPEPWRLVLSASFASWWGRLPGLAPGLMAHAGVTERRWLLLGELGYFPERHASVDDSPAGGDLLMASGGGQVGYLLTSGRLGVGPAAGVELQWLHGSGTGIEHPGEADVMLLSLQAGGRLSVAIAGPWQLSASLLASAPLNRPRFVLDDIGPVHRPEVWGLRLGLGLQWRRP